MPLDFGLLSMTELRTRPGEILDRVADGGEAFIIERGGRRKACLVPLSVFFPDIAPSRIADEINELVEQGEKPHATFTESHELAFRFPHSLADGTALNVEVILPHG
jgi:prevent-host-death family protein